MCAVCVWAAEAFRSISRIEDFRSEILQMKFMLVQMQRFHRNEAFPIDFESSITLRSFYYNKTNESIEMRPDLFGSVQSMGAQNSRGVNRQCCQ